MKPIVKVCYKGSGVKFTEKMSVVMLIFGILFLVAGIVAACLSYDEGVIIFLAAGLITGLSFLSMSALFRAVSSIARTALYKRTLIEAQYRVEEVYDHRETAANDFTEND